MKTAVAAALAAALALSFAGCQTQTGGGSSGGPAAAGAGALVDTAGTAVALAGVAVKGVVRGDMTGALTSAGAPPGSAVPPPPRTCGKWGHDAQGRRICRVYR